MNRKKRIFTMISLIVIVPVMLFCTGTEESTTTQIEVSSPGEFPIVEDKVTLNIYIGVTEQVEDMATNDFTKWYEDKTNVHVEWEQVPLDQAKDKLNILLASGDYPEIISVKDGFSRAELMVYGSQGILIPLNSYIDQHGFFIKETLKEEPYIKDAITAPGGNIYTLPYVSEVYHSSMSNKIWVYQPWMDKLGLKVPQTTEDFYEMLKAFKTQDPNGNGKSDEIPFAGCVKGWRTEVGWTIMNAFIYSGDSNMRNRLMSENGKINFVANKPDWRDGVRFYRRLYEEGLIAPESFTQDRNGFRQMGEHPDAPILGSAIAGWFGYFVINNGESGRFEEYTVIPPLEGPNGMRQTSRYNHLVQPHFSITDKAKYPDIAIKYVDWLYSREGARSAGSGIKGVGWDDADPNGVTVLGEPAKFKTISTYGTLTNYKWHHSMGLRGAADNLLLSQTDPGGLEERLYRYTKQMYEPYARKEILPYMWFDSDIVNEVAELEQNINNYVDSSFARFVAGELDIEGQDWANYVDQLEKIGVEKYVEYFQSAYDETH